MDERLLQRKIAANEAVLREANEAIERGLWPGDEDRVVRFRCECAELECNQAVELTTRGYERVRANPRRFFALPGHELGEGGELAEAMDPRG
jgi:hypothetical protein